MNTTRIIIMAKLPEAGLAKTRLIPALGPIGAATLARLFLNHTLTEAVNANVSAVELCISPFDAGAHARLNIPASVTCTAQATGDLGERMSRCALHAITLGESVILAGTDCPALDRDVLSAMASALEYHDTVIVPASDGGYVALGLNEFHESFFTGICWSTDSVFETTLARIYGHGLSVKIMPVLNDIDTPEDLSSLPEKWQSILQAILAQGTITPATANTALPATQ